MTVEVLAEQPAAFALRWRRARVHVDDLDGLAAHLRRGRAGPSHTCFSSASVEAPAVCTPSRERMTWPRRGNSPAIMQASGAWVPTGVCATVVNAPAAVAGASGATAGVAAAERAPGALQAAGTVTLPANANDRPCHRVPRTRPLPAGMGAGHGPAGRAAFRIAHRNAARLTARGHRPSASPCTANGRTCSSRLTRVLPGSSHGIMCAECSNQTPRL